MRQQHVAIAALAVGLTIGLGAERLAAADHPRHHATAEMEKCLKECARCAKECESCLTHCVYLVADGKKEHVRTLRTCNDCGDMCAMAGKFVARDGPFMNQMCDACARA